jgi:hypothetical protein
MFSNEAAARIDKHRNGFSRRSFSRDVSGDTTINGKWGVSLVLNMSRYLSAVSVSRKLRLMMSSATSSEKDNLLRPPG